MISRQEPMTEEAYREYYRTTYRPFRAGLGQALRRAREDAGLTRAKLGALTYTPEDFIASFEEAAENIQPSLGFLVLASTLLDRPLAVLMAKAEGGEVDDR